AGQGAGLALVVQELQAQAVLARPAAHLQAQHPGGGGTEDGDLGALHAPSCGDRYRTRPFSSSPSRRAQTRRQTATSPGAPKSPCKLSGASRLTSAKLPPSVCRWTAHPAWAALSRARPRASRAWLVRRPHHESGAAGGWYTREWTASSRSRHAFNRSFHS